MDLWLADPVTETLFRCLEWYKEDIQDEINTGSCVDSSNADQTSSNIHLRMGNIQALITASQFEAVLKRYGMVEAENVQAIA